MRLAKDTWKKHIEEKHAEMRANFDRIGETVEQPDRILKDGKNEVFERMCDVAGFSRPRRLYVHVVVGWRRGKMTVKKSQKRADKRVVGDIRTTYTSGTQHRGQQVWPTAN